MSETLSKIRASFLDARKARETIVSSFLGTIIGEIESRATVNSEGNKVVSEEVVIQVLKSFEKKNAETLKIYKEREIISTQALLERNLIERFLPEQLTAEQIRLILETTTLERNVGSAMKYLKDTYAGEYDGKIASQVVKEWVASEPQL